MKTDEFKHTSIYKTIGITVLTILFGIAFVLLINKHTYNFGDILNTSFNYKTVEGKELVVRDKDAIYPKFFVIFFNTNHNTYIVHQFNYYETDSQYDLEYHRLFDNVIDYNMNENMIRLNYGEGYGNFYTVKNNLKTILQINNYEVY